MIDIRLDQDAQVPLFRQITDQIKQLVAANRVQPGERLPTVRDLAHYLGISPGTVVRAYVELEREQVISSRRGAGTVVTTRAVDPQVSMLRHNRLSNMVSGSILEALSLGFTIEEVEATFSLHAARWRQERAGREAAGRAAGGTRDRNTILIVGSHDLALNLLVDQFKRRSPEANVQLTYAGSLGGLIALQQEKADMAGVHLIDEETGEYNYPYIKHILPGREMAVVHLAYRIQGLMFAGGNPKRIQGLGDLRRADITIVNRQKGSGTRVLLDLRLRQQGITPSELRGYDREMDTHLAVATAVARGDADAGLGIEAAARTCGIGFLPLFRESYDLVIPMADYRSDVLSPFLQIIASEDFKKLVTSIGGYDVAQTGATTYIGQTN